MRCQVAESEIQLFRSGSSRPTSNKWYIYGDCITMARWAIWRHGDNRITGNLARTCCQFYWSVDHRRHQQWFATLKATVEDGGTWSKVPRTSPARPHHINVINSGDRSRPNHGQKGEITGSTMPSRAGMQTADIASGRPSRRPRSPSS